MKLYYSPAACSLVSHIILRETGLPFSLHKVDLATHSLADGSDYYEISAKGQVPILELADGQRLSEGPIIAQYLAEQAQHSSLLPAVGTLARYRVLEWQNYITSELHKSFSVLFNPAIGSDSKMIIRTALRKKLAWVSTQLEGKTFLTGTDFSVSDAYLFVVCGWAKFVDLKIDDLMPLQHFLTSVKQRPQVAAALQAEAAL
ncbi:MAG: glutathione transferase GstA [Undibacterium sp.]|nr:glutathione transferase GstA [Undibacterium sp.]